MKRIIPYFLALSLLLAGCYSTKPIDSDRLDTSSPTPGISSETYILLSDHGITVDGEDISSDSAQAVYAANDIIYYEAGHDFTYGEGTAEDEHSAAEAAAHTVVHISQPGAYRLSGTLSRGQIAVDLGEDAENDPSAVVTLILDGVGIECTVAPAIIFYNVYECGDKDNPTMDVDTSAAGANIIIADSSSPELTKLNEIKGSYVARIYKSYTLSEDGTEVIDSKKLHKYDAALYSKMSMNISGGENESAILYIRGENEGLDSEMHLTINSGNIQISSGNDGINTNEDGVSVTTINGGDLSIRVTGSTGEGDGIDSNGWLVINGGSVRAMACADSADSGIDADNGVYINGGSVVATGNMLDRIEGSQTYAVFSFALPQEGGSSYSLKNAGGEIAFEASTANAFSTLLISSPELVSGSYTLWHGDTQLGGTAAEGGMMGGFGWGRPDGEFAPPENPEDGSGHPPQVFSPAGEEGENNTVVVPIPNDGDMPEPPDDGFHMTQPEHGDGFDGLEPPEGFEEGMELPRGEKPGGGFGGFVPGELSGEFLISEGANFFINVHALPQN